jgi:hypothetical protein
LRDGFTAALAVVQRIDSNVQKVLGERLCMATYLEEQRLDEEGIVQQYDYTGLY